MTLPRRLAASGWKGTQCTWKSCWRLRSESKSQPSTRYTRSPREGLYKRNNAPSGHAKHITDAASKHRREVLVRSTPQHTTSSTPPFRLRPPTEHRGGVPNSVSPPPPPTRPRRGRNPTFYRSICACGTLGAACHGRCTVQISVVTERTRLANG